MQLAKLVYADKKRNVINPPPREKTIYFAAPHFVCGGRIHFPNNNTVNT